MRKKLDPNTLYRYIYNKYAGKTRIVRIFDKSILSNFNLSGEMIINKNTARMLTRIFVVIAPLARQIDIEFNNPSK